MNATKAVLTALVGRFQKRAVLCRELETIAVDETRWHDAASMKSASMIWDRAARMVQEEISSQDEDVPPTCP